MDPQVSTSFIPKEALTAQKARSSGMGLIGLIALLLFILSIVAAGGVFGYEQLLKKQIVSKKASLDAANGAFDAPTIQDLQRLDSRIEQSKVLLGKHVAPSAIFDFLAQYTLRNVQFNSFDYSLKPDGSGTIELTGTADSFSTVALQSDALGGQKLMRDVIFSNINIDPGGKVAFTVSATADQSLLSYANLLAATPALQPQQEPQQQAQPQDEQGPQQ